mmetsp:Transcript_51684/g.92146  ORF Transcript_51684/g.92146 Transcript_51684/m.92146 type:complete len:380 (+) Transcript_51684:1425-2564(+)
MARRQLLWRSGHARQVPNVDVSLVVAGQQEIVSPVRGHAEELLRTVDRRVEGAQSPYPDPHHPEMDERVAHHRADDLLLLQEGHCLHHAWWRLHPQLLIHFVVRIAILRLCLQSIGLGGGAAVPRQFPGRAARDEAPCVAAVDDVVECDGPVPPRDSNRGSVLRVGDVGHGRDVEGLSAGYKELWVGLLVVRVTLGPPDDRVLHAGVASGHLVFLAVDVDQGPDLGVERAVEHPDGLPVHVIPRHHVPVGEPDDDFAPRAVHARGLDGASLVFRVDLLGVGGGLEAEYLLPILNLPDVDAVGVEGQHVAILIIVQARAKILFLGGILCLADSVCQGPCPDVRRGCHDAPALAVEGHGAEAVLGIIVPVVSEGLEQFVPP